MGAAREAQTRCKCSGHALRAAAASPPGMAGPRGLKPLRRHPAAHSRPSLGFELADPARLALLALLAVALLGGCGLVAALAAHASAAGAVSGTVGSLRLGQSEGAPRHANAIGAPRRAAGRAAAARAAADVHAGLPGGGARAGLQPRAVDLGPGSVGDLAAGEPGRELPANRAEAVLQPLVVPEEFVTRDIPDSHTRPAGRARAAAKRAARAAEAAAAGGAQFAGGPVRAAGPQRGSAYLALCAIMKDQNAEVSVHDWRCFSARALLLQTSIICSAVSGEGYGCQTCVGSHEL